MSIRIIFPGGTVDGRLMDTALGRSIYDSLPIEEYGSTWGEEIYFSLPMDVPLARGSVVETVDAGDLALWPPGNAFCLFWGPTPASRGSEIRPADPVEVFGRIDGDLSPLKKASSGMVSVEALADD